MKNLFLDWLFEHNSEPSKLFQRELEASLKKRFAKKSHFHWGVFLPVSLAVLVLVATITISSNLPAKNQQEVAQSTIFHQSAEADTLIALYDEQKDNLDDIGELLALLESIE